MTAVGDMLSPPAVGADTSEKPAAFGHHTRTGLGGRCLLGLIRLYQLARRGRPSPCRYVPSCSQYAAIAIERHGAGRGTWLAVRRLSRCHPWGGFGADPVPDRPGVRNP